MRESNFAFPTQNRASVCISLQLYNRRGAPFFSPFVFVVRRLMCALLSSASLDSTSPLPLLNSFTHLTQLTSTSPRICETDGGLERLVRILRDFCMSPPPPEKRAFICTSPTARAHFEP